MIILPEMLKRKITKRVICVNICVLVVGQLFSQVNTTLANTHLGKPPIDTSTINNWYGVDEDQHVAISNDGKWFTYRVRNLPRDANTLYVESTDKKWSRSFINAEKVVFSDDNKLFVFKRNDSLFILKLGVGNELQIISKVKVFKTVSSSTDHWLAYQLQGSNELFLFDLRNGERRKYANTDNFLFNDQGTILLLQHNNNNASAISWMNLQNNSSATIYSGDNVVSSRFDKSGAKVIFSVLHNDKSYSIWQYNEGEKGAIERVNHNTVGIEKGYSLQAFVEFSNDSKYFFIKVRRNRQTLFRKSNASEVNIWSYKDSYIQSFQVKNPPQEKDYTYVVSTNLTSLAKAFLITGEDEIIHVKPKIGDYVVVTWNTGQQVGDRFWKNQESKSWLVSLKDGSRTDLDQNGIDLFSFSPSGKYVLIWDSKIGSYLCYDLNTHKKNIISSGAPDKQFVQRSLFYENKNPSFNSFVGICGWLSKDEGVLVYDNYDIWKLDLTGKRMPENVTKGFGIHNGIKFRCINQKYEESIPPNGQLILSAFNASSSENGFYSLDVNRGKQPELLTMGSYTYFHARGIDADSHDFQRNMEPVKASQANCWIVKRHNFNEAPNYFLTKDFRRFIALTDLQPQKDVSWLKAELVQFKQTDGSISQGILYKPEKFDSLRKYPVVINYYSQFSHRLFEFPNPEILNDAHLNIPWFLSRDYLVFTPDIYFNMDFDGESALNAVSGAAKHFSELSYVDTNRIGISGHSTAGGFTNYIITQTNMFAAALCGAPGNADMISRALQLVENRNQLASYESMFEQMIWGNPSLWTKSSPIMSADNVTTPYLIFHCRPDGVPFQQSVEMFIALRRLGKKVWMLEYDNGNHALYDKKDAEDFTIRVTQFFDHYLKNAPAPKWITEGVPAKMKGIVDRLELDTENKVP